MSFNHTRFLDTVLDSLHVQDGRVSEDGDGVGHGAVEGVGGAGEVGGGGGEQQPGSLGVAGHPGRHLLEAALKLPQLHPARLQLGPHLLRHLVQVQPEDGLLHQSEAEMWSRDELSTNERYLAGDQGQGLEGGGVVEPLVVSLALAAEVVEPGHLVQLRHQHAVVLLLLQPRPQPRHLGAPVLASVRQVVANNLLSTQSPIQPPAASTEAPSPELQTKVREDFTITEKVLL